ncbi:MAG: hypothetical protein ABIT20_04760 [Gemmatimonadaceae bacterium]
MMRAPLVAIALSLAGCGADTNAVLPVASPETFAGTWQSVTPSLEFVRLSLVSKSSEQGVMGARITFSGAAWVGSGRIDRDSLVLGMSLSGAAQPSATIVARGRGADTLQVQMRVATASPIALTLIRQE